MPTEKPVVMDVDATSTYPRMYARAFGAHGLKARLAPDLLAIYHTGVEYQLYHALGIVLLGLFVSQHAAAGAPAGATVALGNTLAKPRVPPLEPLPTNGSTHPAPPA